MKNKLIITLAFLLGMSSYSNAFVAGFVNTFGNGGFADKDGILTNGITVRIIALDGDVPAFGPTFFSDILAASTTVAQQDTASDFLSNVGTVNINQGDIVGQEGVPLYILADFGSQVGLWRNQEVDTGWIGGDDDNLTQVDLFPGDPITALVGTFTDDGNIMGLTEAIPEPSTYIMMLMGAAGIFFFVRRRRA